MTDYRFYLAVLMLIPAYAQAAEAPSSYEIPVGEGLRAVSGGYVDSNVEYSRRMFDRQSDVTNKPVMQLEERASGTLAEGKLYLGGRFIATHIWEGTNTKGKFPILSRLPPSHPKVDAEDIGVINDGSFNATLTLPWVTGFIQREYTQVEYPGQNRWQWRKYFLTVGDLSRYPVYLSVGKNTINFGDMTSYSPFQHDMNVHYFWAQNDDNRPLAELGYVADGWQLAGTVMKGGRGRRVLNTPAEDAGRYNNFALNVRKQIPLGEDTKLTVGGGYLRGTIYDSTLAHHPPAVGLADRTYNGAWDVNATLEMKQWDVAAEVTRTVDDWPATSWPVTALTAQTRYRDSIQGLPTNYSFVFSYGEQGAPSTEWERMIQAVAGVETQLTPNLSVGAEWVHSEGFAPLIAIKAASIRDVTADALVVGTKVTF